MFDTYGPFALKAHSAGQIDDLYAKINGAAEDLESGFGVYAIFALNDTGKLLPWYVGRTYGNFGARLKQHFDLGKFRDLDDKNGITIFLLARTKNGKRISSTEASGSDLAAVSRLELLLIGTCMRLNPSLLNKQLKRFHEPFYVAGFLDRGQEHNRDHAAIALAELLETP